MEITIARELFDLQQKVVDKCLSLAPETNQREKEELLVAAKKAMEVERFI